MHQPLKLRNIIQREDHGSKVEVYTWRSCPCIRAKELLRSGVEFIEYDGDETARSQMQRRANGRRSVPQILSTIILVVATSLRLGRTG